MDIHKEYEEYEVLLPVGTMLKFVDVKHVAHKSYTDATTSGFFNESQYCETG